MLTILNGIVFTIAYLWNAALHAASLVKFVRTLQRVAIGAILGSLILAMVFPEAVASRLTIYQETLSPYSTSSELAHRTRDYPLANFVRAFDHPNWLYGYGIGTTALGVQYLTRYFGVLPVGGVESGFGTVVLEFGFLGLLLWLLLALSITISCWRVVRSLRGSRFFPIAFLFFWFPFLILLPQMWGGIQQYQDYINNSYLWLFIGMLFRLPEMERKIRNSQESTVFAAKGQ